MREQAAQYPAIEISKKNLLSLFRQVSVVFSIFAAAMVAETLAASGSLIPLSFALSGVYIIWVEQAKNRKIESKKDANKTTVVDVGTEFLDKSSISIDIDDIDLSNMPFESEAQKVCYKRVVPWMQDLFGEAAVRFEDEPLFIVTIGSAVSSTRVVPWGEDDALVVTRSFVATDLTVTPELSYYLLRANNGVHFGRFALDSENDIVFEHSLVGSSCNYIDLKHSVTTVIRLADDYDDEIVARWGGQRALERWSSS